MQCWTIQKVKLYEFELDNNATETTLKFCYTKCDGAVEHSRISKWLKTLHSCNKNHEDQARLERLKSVNPDPNPVICTLRKSVKIDIAQCSMVHIYYLSKSNRSCQIVPHVSKILQHFNSISYNILVYYVTNLLLIICYDIYTTLVTVLTYQREH